MLNCLLKDVQAGLNPAALLMLIVCLCEIKLDYARKPDQTYKTRNLAKPASAVLTESCRGSEEISSCSEAYIVL